MRKKALPYMDDGLAVFKNKGVPNVTCYEILVLIRWPSEVFMLAGFNKIWTGGS